MKIELSPVEVQEILIRSMSGKRFITDDFLVGRRLKVYTRKQKIILEFEERK